MNQTKVCKTCKIEKSIDEFYVNMTLADNHLNDCKECHNRKKRERYAQKKAEFEKQKGAK